MINYKTYLLSYKGCGNGDGKGYFNYQDCSKNGGYGFGTGNATGIYLGGGIGRGEGKLSGNDELSINYNKT